MSDVNQVHLEKLESLPEGWAETTVSKIVQMISTNKKKLAQKNYLDKGDFPVVDQGQEFIAGYSNNEALIIHGEPPFIVFGDHTKAFKFANFNFVPGADGVKIMKSLEVDPKWCFYIFQAIKLPNKGYARHFQYLKEAYLPVPPPEQQKRIVAKIEELFSHIDAGIEALKKSKQLLKQYRQSVLKAAVTGELTKEWRETNKDKLESASQLLERILKERRQKWEEQQLEQFKAKGKMPKNDKWKEKYKELAPISDAEFDGLPELPDSWIYTRLGNVINEPKYGTSKKCAYDSNGIGVLRIPNVANGVIDSEDLKFAKFDESEVEAYELREGDILTIRSNGSINLVGKCAMIGKNDTSYLYAGYLIMLRPNSNVADSFFLINVLNSIFLRNQIESKAKSTSGVNNINSGELQSLIIPVCVKCEQMKISSLVDEKLEPADRLLSDIENQLLKVEKNKQSILASAFSGRIE
ncbi:MAG: restriction endonuclease subunit S [Candidatus Thiodiazotropha endolucinida]